MTSRMTSVLRVLPVKFYKKTYLIGLAACAAIACLAYAQDKKALPVAVAPASYAESKEWPTYGHDSGGMQIGRAHV